MTSSSRCVRLLKRASEYQRSRWYDSIRQPAWRSRRTGRPHRLKLPMASTTMVTFTPFARAFRQGVDELIGDAAGLEDVALHVHRPRRVANGLEHRGIELDAVREDVTRLPWCSAV